MSFGASTKRYHLTFRKRTVSKTVPRAAAEYSDQNDQESTSSNLHLPLLYQQTINFADESV